jgi:transposase
MIKRRDFCKKRSTTWVGYKVHLTESCEPHLPLLITHVETTSAPVSDNAMTAPIHAELERKHLLPTEHIVDTGYVDATLLVERKPRLPDQSGRTHPKELPMASQSTHRFRCRSLSHRLATAPSNVPARTDQYQLDSGDRQSEERGHQDQILDQGLSGLSISIALDPIQSPHTPYRDHSSASAVSGLDAKARAGKDEGIYPGQGLASEHWGHHLEGEFGRWVCAVLATLGWRERICNIWLLPLLGVLVRSIAWFNGLPGAQTRRSAFARLYDAA